MALVCSGAVAGATETGSDGLPLNGMAPLYFPLPMSGDKAVSAVLALPEVSANKHWYANWIMIVGQPDGAAHDAFVQVGLIRRPDQNRSPYIFCAWQAQEQPRIEFRQLHTVADTPHRFTIAQTQRFFVLIVDGREAMRLRMPSLARAHAYAQVGPEVFGEGDALSGEVLYAATGSEHLWKRVGEPDSCRYENHGVSLRITGAAWASTGHFDRNEPSGFKGNCKGL